MVTSQEVLGWLEQTAPEWEVLPDNRVAAIAAACNHEVKRRAAASTAEKEIGLQRIRQFTKDARNASDVLLKVIPKIFTDLDKMDLNSGRLSQYKGDLSDTLTAAHVALSALRPFLDPSKKAGGQTSIDITFAERIANHLTLSVDTVIPTTADGPLIKFLVRMFEEALDQEIDNQALSRAMARRFKKKRESLRT